MKRFHLMLLFAFVIQMCPSCHKEPREDEALVSRVFAIRIPSGAETRIAKHGRDGTIAVIRMSATAFASFQGACTNYSAWHPVQEGQVFEVAGHKFIGGSNIRGVYSVGKGKGGLVPVLIWDEPSASLLAILSEGVM